MLNINNSELVCSCKKITAEFINNNRIYCDANIVEFDTKLKCVDLNINITKHDNKITIMASSSDYVDCFSLFQLALDIIKFNALFCGFCLDINSLQYSDSLESEERLELVAKEHISRMLISFTSSTELKGYSDEFSCYPSSCEYGIYFKKWQEIEASLGLTHNMFMLATCKSKITVDIKFTWLIQCFQPLSELLETKKLITIFKNDKGVKVFKNQLMAIFDTYATEIFQKEFSENTNKDKLLKYMVNTRNRIAHVSTKKNKSFNGEQCVMYYFMLIYLYRHIILQLLGINYDDYKKNICERICKINNHNGIIDSFLS